MQGQIQYVAIQYKHKILDKGPEAGSVFVFKTSVEHKLLWGVLVGNRTLPEARQCLFIARGLPTSVYSHDYHSHAPLYSEL